MTLRPDDQALVDRATTFLCSEAAYPHSTYIRDLITALYAAAEREAQAWGGGRVRDEEINATVKQLRAELAAAAEREAKLEQSIIEMDATLVSWRLRCRCDQGWRER